MNKQEVFNNAWNWFSQPDAKLAKNEAAPEGLNCFYRYPEDQSRRCAIGCQIPDEIYKPEMEGIGIVGLFTKFEAVSEHFGFTSYSENPERSNDEEQFLIDLQRCHDHAYTTADALEAFRRFAADKGLTIPA